LLKNANVSKSAPVEERPENFQIYYEDKVMPPKDLPMQIVAQTGKPMESTELEYRFEDGHSAWLYGNAVLLLREDGKPQGVVEAFIDITERKSAEVALRERQATLKVALASMTYAVFITDTEGNFIDFDEVFATYYKFHSKEECYKTLSEYMDLIEVYLPTGD
jgi:PAS domain-containing protein